MTYKAGEALGAPDHPHSGASIVTYMIQGAVQHADTMGNSGRIGTDDLQLMHAGSGVVHSEMPDDTVCIRVMTMR